MSKGTLITVAIIYAAFVAYHNGFLPVPNLKKAA